MRAVTSSAPLDVAARQQRLGHAGERGEPVGRIRLLLGLLGGSRNSFSASAKWSPCICSAPRASRTRGVFGPSLSARSVVARAAVTSSIASHAREAEQRVDRFRIEPDRGLERLLCFRAAIEREQRRAAQRGEARAALLTVGTESSNASASAGAARRDRRAPAARATRSTGSELLRASSSSRIALAMSPISERHLAERDARLEHLRILRSNVRRSTSAARRSPSAALSARARACPPNPSTGRTTRAAAQRAQPRRARAGVCRWVQFAS